MLHSPAVLVLWWCLLVSCSRLAAVAPPLLQHHSNGFREVIDHPVLFNMPALLYNRDAELEILQGLYDLQFEFTPLTFLYTGRVLPSNSTICTHALVSRFPSVEALTDYYDTAITSVAASMRPYDLNEYAVDYRFFVNDDQVEVNGTDLALHVTFVRVSSNASSAAVEHMIQAFLGLAEKMDYVLQLTAGENLYLREVYRTYSHGFLAYMHSGEKALDKFETDPYFNSVLEEAILPMSESHISIGFLPYTPSSRTLGLFTSTM